MKIKTATTPKDFEHKLSLVESSFEDETIITYAPEVTQKILIEKYSLLLEKWKRSSLVKLGYFYKYAKNGDLMAICLFMSPIVSGFAIQHAFHIKIASSIGAILGTLLLGIPIFYFERINEKVSEQAIKNVLKPQENPL